MLAATKCFTAGLDAYRAKIFYEKVSIWLSIWLSGLTDPHLAPPLHVSGIAAQASSDQRNSWSPLLKKKEKRKMYFIEAIAIHHSPILLFQQYLLPAIKNDIQKNKKLNVHLYNAIKKALYKPAAWFKGLLFPLITVRCLLLRLFEFSKKKNSSSATKPNE